MNRLSGKVAWVTGAGSGIGEAAAVSLAAHGVTVVLTGRRKKPLSDVARRIAREGGQAWVRPGDLSVSRDCQAIARAIDKKFGRLDILVNNAGANVRKRAWRELEMKGVDAVVGANLSSAFYCALAALPMMRRQSDGLMIHTASWAGRFVSPLAGPAYSAVKHGVVAMSYSLNMEEFGNGIRSTVICPAEVATQILDKRPVPVSQADRDLMLQPEDLADAVIYIASAHNRVCVNEMVISPTWNRSYLRLGGHGVPEIKRGATSKKKSAPKKSATKKSAAKKLKKSRT
jgi:NAD(P)-dependent dehydrogenase (short-subunit alcohol dehydrogenase family)